MRFRPEQIEIADVTRRRDRPYGARFGSLVHAVLALVPLDATDAAVRTIAGTQGRILGASESEIEGATDAAVAVLEHPLMQRARAAHASGCLRRELPVAHVVDDGTLIEGTVDLLIDDADGVVVVDFKTDRDLEEDLERYRRQVAFYCEALSRGLRRTTSGAILRV
jgi:ATP-dependent exoDNAse (exonuclease V) beta subunit